MYKYKNTYMRAYILLYSMLGTCIWVRTRCPTSPTSRSSTSIPSSRTGPPCSTSTTWRSPGKFSDLVPPSADLSVISIPFTLLVLLNLILSNKVTLPLKISLVFVILDRPGPCSNPIFKASLKKQLSILQSELMY